MTILVFFKLQAKQVKYTIKYLQYYGSWFICQSICISVHPVISFTQLCYTAQPCQVGEGTWTYWYNFTHLQISPQAVTGHWKEKQGTDDLISWSPCSLLLAPWPWKTTDWLPVLLLPPPHCDLLYSRLQETDTKSNLGMYCTLLVFKSFNAKL